METTIETATARLNTVTGVIESRPGCCPINHPVNGANELLSDPAASDEAKDAAIMIIVMAEKKRGDAVVSIERVCRACLRSDDEVKSVLLRLEKAGRITLLAARGNGLPEIADRAYAIRSRRGMLTYVSGLKRY